MWTPCLILYVVICESFGQTTSENGCALSDTEQFIDDLLITVRSKFSGKPTPLANRNGIINLSGGEVIGLSTLNRTGPIEVLACNSTWLSLRISLATEKPIRARYNWDGKVATKTVRGIAHARAPALQGKLQLSRNLRTGGDFNVDDVILEPSEVIEVNISGLVDISWLWSRAITFVTTSLRKSLTLASSEGVRVVLDRILNDLDT